MCCLFPLTVTISSANATTEKQTSRKVAGELPIDVSYSDFLFLWLLGGKLTAGNIKAMHWETVLSQKESHLSLPHLTLHHPPLDLRNTI